MQGITEDDELLTRLEMFAYYCTVVEGWSAVSFHATVTDVTPYGTGMIMIGHGFVSLLFSSKRTH
jgi:hypothetical protein